MHNHWELWLIPGLPLAAAVLVGLFGKALKSASRWPVLLAAGGSCAIAMTAVVKMAAYDAPALVQTDAVNWFSAGQVTVTARLMIDPITSVMLTAITFVGFWIALFSVGYMHGDPGYPRFFAVLSGFLFSMCGLVMCDSLLLIYAFWEGVGLCSYLLIGFWFEKPSAAAAARKGFLVTRLGDAGFILGIFLLWKSYGTLNLNELFRQVHEHRMPGLTTACLLLFCGAVGKSAQFPLHVWLPDAMEGPTPASALIHAATMVTAGVYLVGRCMPLFVLAPTALAVVAVIGAFTAILAALIAVTQHDLKRVLAYSTVSQLGFMFAALGCGQGSLASFAVTAALFHLLTHAFFKALLFLASGSVMHAMGNVIDIRQIGGLRRVLPTTHWTFACGALALAGVPPLAGFFSKDEILAVAKETSHLGPTYYWLYLAVFVTLLVTALITAFYTGRAYFRTFWGEERIPEEAGHHAHESPPVMTLPLMVLAVGAVVIGGALWFGHRFAHFLDRTQAFGEYLHHHEHHPDRMLMVVSAILAIFGFAGAWWIYVRQPDVPRRLAAAMPNLYRLSSNRFYWDEIYAALLVGPLRALAILGKVFDLIIDGMIDLAGQIPGMFGSVLRPIQNGLVQFYALAMILGLTVFLGILVFRS
ncbi:MAG: NADH-quinone oxidoreductase subunit L [Gemmataceae bacterium]